MSRPDISILVHNLSANNVVRMYPIAKVLERRYTIEVAGFAGPGGVFAPYKDEFRYVTVPTPAFGSWRKGASEIRSLLRGKVIYAFKPNPLSLGIGLLESRSSGRPLVLDIEDFDLAFQYTRGFPLLLKNLLMFWDIQSFGYLWLADRFARRADRITVGSTFLQKRYGGTILPHGADTSAFDPGRFSAEEIRSRWHVDGSFNILFAGKVSDHKGVDAILRMVLRINNSAPAIPLRLIIVGGKNTDENIRALAAAGGAAFVHIPNQPHERMPELLTTADVVLLPQHRSRYTSAQIPGKLYEAMAMGRPVIASDVSDLSLILSGCGITGKDEADFPEISSLQQEITLVPPIHEKLSLDLVIKGDIQDDGFRSMRGIRSREEV